MKTTSDRAKRPQAQAGALAEKNSRIANRITRRDRLQLQGHEHWRPPNFGPVQSRLQHMLAAVRRFLDPAAGSIWRDLAVLLSKEHSSLLDVGCGAQPYRGLVPASVRYQGIDIIQAPSVFGYDVPDTLYFKGDDWPVAAASFDCVLCSEVLEHVLDPSAFLARACLALRPGGRLILTVPFAARWHYIPWDYWRYSPSGLQHLLGRTGFEGVKVYARGNPLTVACSKLMALGLPLFFTRGSFPAKVAARAVAVLVSPSLMGLAILANLTLMGDWGDDCLGYTVTAVKGGQHHQGSLAGRERSRVKGEA